MTDVFYPESAHPAPGELEVVRRFVNTLDLENHEPEKLERPEDLAEWLTSAGLLRKRPPVKPADLKRARELREALRKLLLANNGYELESDEAVTIVNQAAARAKVGVTFDGNAGYRMEPAAAGVDEGIGNLLAIVARAMNDGSWAR